MVWFDFIPRPVTARMFCIVGCLASMAWAQGGEQQQTPTPATPPAAQQPQTPAATNPAAAQPGTQQPAAPAAETKAPAQPAKGSLGTLLVDSSKPRCWPTAHSPVYEETLAKGVVVGVGRSEGGFRQVTLPLGPVGFVHKKFVTDWSGGKVATKGKAVAFRYRPKTGEPPVTSLAEGTELVVLGEQDEWWRVRTASVECWLPEADVQVFEQPPETMTRSFAELEKTQAAEVQAYTAMVEKRKEEARLEVERQHRLLELQGQLAQELKKPLAAQSFAEVDKATTEFLAQLPENSVARSGTVELQKRIAQQKWVAQATAVRDEAPVTPKDLPQPRPEVTDPLERFQAVGFLRWEKGITGPGRFVVEKGGQRQYLVTCTSGRYDLSLFVNREVGLIGPRRRPSADSLRVLDVEKVEVLAANVR